MIPADERFCADNLTSLEIKFRLEEYFKFVLVKGAVHVKRDIFVMLAVVAHFLGKIGNAVGI